MLDDKNLITNSRNIYCDWVNSFYKRGSGLYKLYIYIYYINSSLLIINKCLMHLKNLLNIY